jgi:hypothetical protein
MPGCSSNGIQQAGAPRHMLRLTAAARPRQIRKPHSPAHADRGFLHGGLSYAKQRPKPFTKMAIQTAPAITQKLSFTQSCASSSADEDCGNYTSWGQDCFRNFGNRKRASPVAIVRQP